MADELTTFWCGLGAAPVSPPCAARGGPDTCPAAMVDDLFPSLLGFDTAVGTPIGAADGRPDTVSAEPHHALRDCARRRRQRLRSTAVRQSRRASYALKAFIGVPMETGKAIRTIRSCATQTGTDMFEVLSRDDLLRRRGYRLACDESVCAALPLLTIQSFPC